MKKAISVLILALVVVCLFVSCGPDPKVNVVKMKAMVSNELDNPVDAEIRYEDCETFADLANVDFRFTCTLKDHSITFTKYYYDTKLGVVKFKVSEDKTESTELSTDPVTFHQLPTPSLQIRLIATMNTTL